MIKVGVKMYMNKSSINVLDNIQPVSNTELNRRYSVYNPQVKRNFLIKCLHFLGMENNYINYNLFDSTKYDDLVLKALKQRSDGAILDESNTKTTTLDSTLNWLVNFLCSDISRILLYKNQLKKSLCFIIDKNLDKILYSNRNSLLTYIAIILMKKYKIIELEENIKLAILELKNIIPKSNCIIRRLTSPKFNFVYIREILLAYKII